MPTLSSSEHRDIQEKQQRDADKSVLIFTLILIAVTIIWGIFDGLTFEDVPYL